MHCCSFLDIAAKGISIKFYGSHLFSFLRQGRQKKKKAFQKSRFLRYGEGQLIFFSETDHQYLVDTHIDALIPISFIYKYKTENHNRYF